MLEDYLARQPVASWNTVRGVWETSQMSLLCGHLEPFLETWPTSGMMRDGRVYGLPMLAHLTTGLESSLLRTPVADENSGALLSTPTTQDSSGKCRDHGGDLLHDVKCGCSRAERRLPTPKALDGVKGNLKTSQERIDAGHYVDLPNVANDLAGETNWGQYAPAIERWEKVIGRPAPAPTKPDGRDGSHRLSSAFTEWMMGLPEGWVTGCGLTRNEELKACGNGVVPQQAVLALKMLLDNVPLERERERTVMLPTPTVSDTFTDNLKSSQQKPGSMHSVTLPQAVRMVSES